MGGMDDAPDAVPYPRPWAEALARRAVPPRAWEDDHAPWGDAAFSEAFARTASLGPMRARREARFLAGLRRPGNKALDLGCGAGRTAVHLARQGLEVLGVDVGEGALRMAEAARGDLPCTFRVGDLLEDTYPEGPFHLAYAVDGSLAGMPPEAAARALARVHAALAPGAPLLLEMPSVAMAESLDLRQDWYLDRDSLAGTFPQLVLTEDFYLREAAAYVHRISCLDLRTEELATFVQTYAIHAREDLEALLADAGFEPEDARGDFGLDAYAEEESQRLILVARRS